MRDAQGGKRELASMLQNSAPALAPKARGYRQSVKGAQHDSTDSCERFLDPCS